MGDRVHTELSLAVSGPVNTDFSPVKRLEVLKSSCIKCVTFQEPGCQVCFQLATDAAG